MNKNLYVIFAYITKISWRWKMKKIACVALFSAVYLFAGKSPFSMVRTVAWDAAGQPSEEAVDLSICLQRNPVVGNANSVYSREHYEKIIKYWADGLYEMSNGGNYLGNIKFFSGVASYDGCDVLWPAYDQWPRAAVASFNSTSGGLIVSDYWDITDPYYNYLTNDNFKLFEFGMTLTHESMHYLYGLFDEYGTISFVPKPSDPRNNVQVSADPQTDKIHVEIFSDGTMESSQLDAFYSGQYVYFVPNGGTIPSGLWGAPQGSPWLSNGYMTIGDVEWATDGSPSLSFTLKNLNGNKVDIKSAGSGNWGVSLPQSAAATAHTIQNTQWPVGYFKFGKCGSNNTTIPWQWANLSTAFNLNPYSMQGSGYKNFMGKTLSGWEAVVANPVNDVLFKTSSGWDRFWFKSLINRAPTANDVYNTITHYRNYNDATGTWNAGDATWQEAGYCNTKNTVLPYMKVELAGKTEAQYIKDTRKYLNIEWVDRMNMEVVVTLDRSGSMSSNNKMDQAKHASKYVSTAFLGNGSGYDPSDVSVGVTSFSSDVSTVYPFQSNPNKNLIYFSISSVNANGSTALFDAVSDAIDVFTDNPSSTKILYVVSDGINNIRDNYWTEGKKKELYDLCKAKKIAIHTIAYGSDADKLTLATMAAETGGTFYDQPQNLPLDANSSTAAVLSNTVGVEQIAATVLNKSSTSSDIFVPSNTGRVRIYAMYEGDYQNDPIKVLSSTGANLAFEVEQGVLGNAHYLVVDVDSLTLARNSSKKIKIRNNMSSQKLDFRALTFAKRSPYSMNLNMNPSGLYVWPEQVSFKASVLGPNGILAGLTAKGKLTDRNGNVRQFNLYDDGSHGDALAGDGVYFGYMPNITSNGTYQWEISISNKQGRAHTTRIGTSLPDSIAFVESTDSNPFELIRHGQFVVNNCCTENDESTIQPETLANGFLQSGSDVDKFRIVGTKANKSYSLVLQSNNLSSFDKIEVFDPQNMNTPLYSNNVKNSAGNYNAFSLSAELTVPGNIIVVSGAHSTGANYSLLLLESNEALFDVGRFEKISDWHTSNSSIALSNKIHNEGKNSLSTVSGWKIVESRSIKTTEFNVIGDKMSLDVYVPAKVQNQYWLGTVELWANIPSMNRRIQLGSTLSIQPTYNAWMTYDFAVPSSVKTLLSRELSDFRFQVVLNSSDSIWIDNLRFSGHLSDNTVGTYNPHCPGQQGCTSSNPIRLSANSFVDINVTGETWIEVVDIPQNWTPESLKISVFTMDGAELTGSIALSNTSYALTGWEFTKNFQYERNRRYVFKLYNAGNRSYRMNAWTSGQVMNLASNGNSLDYNIVF